MKLSDFSFTLPEHLIAKYPTPDRTASRLLHLNGTTGDVNHKQFQQMLDLVEPGDLLVFNKVRALLGGNIKLLSSGSAPIDPKILSFLKICFGCEVWEGYGLTETSAYSVITMAKDVGVTGGPTFNTKVKLRDIPDMNYLSTDDPPRGEICFKGPGITPGYFLNEEKTKEAFTEDGWFMTGDVGVIYPNGSLKIIDRAKGLLMKAKGIGEDEAYGLLRKTAMDQGRRVADVAQSLVTAADLLS